MRDAEATLRRAAREKAGLAKLGPGALELAAFMDQTGSFLLVENQKKIQSNAPSSGGRLAAPLAGLPPPGAASFGTYAMTIVIFEQLVGDLSSKAPPGTMAAELDPTVDTVTVGGNKGKITTKVTVSATKSASKISVLLRMNISGEVRDAATNAILFKIDSETTGVATGDACPDASGIARAKMTFRGHEDYIDASGARSSSTEDYGGDIQIKADDNAKLAGVTVSASGGSSGELLIGLAAKHAAPAFEKAWRSGICIEVLIDPESQDVDKDSETTVTVKVKHKIEGNELDKQVEDTFTGTKSLEPKGKKQKTPATWKYTAGPKDDDKGDISFESVSNRGIGHAGVTYTVGSGPWTISGTGTENESYRGVTQSTLRVTITALRIMAEKGGALSGTGSMTLTGPVSLLIPNYMTCSGSADYTVQFTATGTRVGSGAEALLRLTLRGVDGANDSLKMKCSASGYALPPVSQPAPFSTNWAFALGQLDLPAAGGTKTFSRSVVIPGDLNADASGTFTVVRAKP